MNFLLIILIIFSFDNVNSADNCATPITGSNLCEVCAANYVLNKDRTCSQCATTGQYLYNNYCFTKIDHCEIYTLYQEGQKCNKCADDYETNEDNSACRLIIEYCEEYENNGNCQSCETGYLLKKDHKECIEIENCIELDTNDKCGKCKDGYLLTTDHEECIEIENCIELDANDKCGKCKDGYSLSTKNSDGDEVDPYCNLIEHCKTYDSEDPLKCTECQIDYKKKTDVLCEYEPCSKYNEVDNTKCEKCKTDYYLLGDSCTYIKDCKSYDTSVTSGTEPKCSTCKDGFGKKSDTECIEIPNCSTYKADDGSKCEKCKDGFRLSENTCLPVIINCKDYGSGNLCEQCNTGFETYEGGKSCTFKEIDNCENQIDDQCQQCENYYIKENNKCIPCDTEGKSCDITIENCEKYQLISGIVVCKECTTGYSKKNNDLACVKNTAADGTAITEILGCVSYTSGNKCGKCFQGYELINDKCYRCPGPYTTGNGITCSLPHLNCAYHDNSGNCIVCPTGYQFTRNHQYCIEEGANDPTKNNNSCVLNLNILILILFALLL